jgi:hypothetical protein
VAHPRQADTGRMSSPWHRAARGDRCGATLTLYGPLRRSLAAAAGAGGVAPVCGCTLVDGHPDPHQGTVNGHGAQRYWLRWDDTGVRIGAGSAGPPYPGQRGERPGSSRHAAATAAIRMASAATPSAPSPRVRPDRAAAGRHAESPESRSQVEALWAIAAALQRLAEVIAAGHDASGPGLGGHRRSHDPHRPATEDEGGGPGP